MLPDWQGEVRPQELFFLFAGCASSKQGQNYLWPAFKRVFKYFFWDLKKNR